MDVSEKFTASNISNIIARILYTGVLLIGIFLLARLAIQLWTAKPIALGEIKFVENGVQNDDLVKGATEEITDYRNHIRDLISEFVSQEKERVEKGNEGQLIYEQLFSDEELADLTSAADAAPEIEFKIQGNDVGSWLNAIRKLIEPRNALRVSVFKRQTDHSFSIGWPRRHKNIDAGHVKQGFRAGHVSPDAINRSIGCRIFWLELAETSPKIAGVSPGIFCQWVSASQEFDIVQSMRANYEQLDEIEAQVKTTLARVGPMADTVAGFPPLQHLVVQLYSQLPDTDPALLVHAQNNLREVIRGGQPKKYEKIKEDIETVLASANEAPISAGEIVEISGGKSGSVRATLTAILADGDGNHFLLLPDYAFPNGASEVFQINEADGSLTRKVATLDRFLPEHAVALARIDEDIKFTNTVNGISMVGTAPPKVDAKVRVLTKGQTIDGKISTTDVTFDSRSASGVVTISNAFQLTPVVRRPGSGGSPIVDENGNLIGLHHSTSRTASVALPAKAILDAYGLKFAE